MMQLEKANWATVVFAALQIVSSELVEAGKEMNAFPTTDKALVLRVDEETSFLSKEQASKFMLGDVIIQYALKLTEVEDVFAKNGNDRNSESSDSSS